MNPGSFFAPPAKRASHAVALRKQRQYAEDLGEAAQLIEALAVFSHDRKHLRELAVNLRQYGSMNPFREK